MILLSDGRTQQKTRLSSVDAPEVGHTRQGQVELGQPYGQTARRFLNDRLTGRDVTARCFESDQYGRSVCEVFVAGSSTNRALVDAGLAWANLANNARYLRDSSMLQRQRDAKAHRRGLWADATPVAPWEWRVQCWRKHVCQSAQ